MTAKEMWEELDGMRDFAIPGTAPLVLLNEAVKQVGGEPAVGTQTNALWQRATEHPRYPRLQSAARMLLQAPSTERLGLIDELIRSDREPVGDFWMARAPAMQIAEAAEGAAYTRFAFNASLHAALIAAETTAKGSHPSSVRFVSNDSSACDLARLCALLLEVKLDVVQSHPFSRSGGDEADSDIEIIVPPFGMQLREVDVLPENTLEHVGAETSRRLHVEAVALIDALVHARGEALLVVSGGALFRQVGLEGAARADMIASGRLKAVFGVPEGMLEPRTMVSAGVIILAPNSEPQNSVRFVDLAQSRFATATARGRLEAREDVSWIASLEPPLGDRDDWAADVSIETVRDHGNILTVGRFLRSDVERGLASFLETHQTEPLGRIAELIRPLALRKSEREGLRVFEAAPSDIDADGVLSEPSRCVTVDLGSARKARVQRLLPGDLLIAVKGTVGTVGIVPTSAPDSDTMFWTPSQSLLIIRTNKELMSPIALFEYLSDDTVQEYILSLAGGAVIKSISIKELRALNVPIPDLETQKRVQNAFEKRECIRREIERLRREISSIRKCVWPHDELAIASTSSESPD